MDDITSKEKGKQNMKRILALVVTMAFVLSGCAKYSIYDETQYYKKISEGVGYRVNSDNYQFCYEALDAVTVDCLQLVENPYLEGVYAVEGLGETLTITKDHHGVTDIGFDGLAFGQLVFQEYNLYYIIMNGAEEIFEVELIIGPEGGVISGLSGRDFHLTRISPLPNPHTEHTT